MLIIIVGSYYKFRTTCSYPRLAKIGESDPHWNTGNNGKAQMFLNCILTYI